MYLLHMDSWDIDYTLLILPPPHPASARGNKWFLKILISEISFQMF